MLYDAEKELYIKYIFRPYKTTIITYNPYHILNGNLTSLLAPIISDKQSLRRLGHVKSGELGCCSMSKYRILTLKFVH